MAEQLFITERKQHWTGSRALVVLDGMECPRCLGPLEEITSEQDALLRHGGYGATRRTVHRFCRPCRWGYDRESTEVRPPRPLTTVAMADDDGWFEVQLVVRTSRDRIDQAKAWLEDMGLAEVRRCDVIALDDDLRRWDGGRPPGVVVHKTAHPVFDDLRRGLHLHEQ